MNNISTLAMVSQFLPIDRVKELKLEDLLLLEKTPNTSSLVSQGVISQGVTPNTISDLLTNNNQSNSELLKQNPIFSNLIEKLLVEVLFKALQQIVELLVKQIEKSFNSDLPQPQTKI